MTYNQSKIRQNIDQKLFSNFSASSVLSIDPQSPQNDKNKDPRNLQNRPQNSLETLQVDTHLLSHLVVDESDRILDHVQLSDISRYSPPKTRVYGDVSDDEDYDVDEGGSGFSRL